MHTHTHPNHDPATTRLPRTSRQTPTHNTILAAGTSVSWGPFFEHCVFFGGGRFRAPFLGTENGSQDIFCYRENQKWPLFLEPKWYHFWFLWCRLLGSRTVGSFCKKKRHQGAPFLLAYCVHGPSRQGGSGGERWATGLLGTGTRRGGSRFFLYRM